MEIFEHFWIDLSSVSEDNVGNIMAERTEDKDAKNNEKIDVKNCGIGSFGNRLDYLIHGLQPEDRLFADLLENKIPGGP